MTRRYHSVRVVLAMAVTAHFAYRVWQVLGLHEARRFELISLFVELAVLYVIWHETFLRPWQMRRWLARVYEHFAEGFSIRRRAPRQGAEATAVTTWIADVDGWFEQTQIGLRKHSPQSAVAFLFEPLRPSVTNTSIHPECQSHYRILSAALENLKSIMEHQDIYY